MKTLLQVSKWCLIWLGSCLIVSIFVSMISSCRAKTEKPAPPITTNLPPVEFHGTPAP